jgi:hypothetical protein
LYHVSNYLFVYFGIEYPWCMNIFYIKEYVFVVVCNLQIFYMMKIDAHKGMGMDLFLEIKYMIILN